MSGNTILLTSVFLFCIGFIGIFRQENIVRVLISIEVMILASVLNFCCFGDTFGELIALIAVILSGITISVVYAIYTTQLHAKNIEFLSED